MEGQGGGFVPAATIAARPDKSRREAPSVGMSNFVSQYYQTSTFHHLSTWRVQMQKMTTEAAQKPLLQLMSNQQQGTDSPTAAGSEGSTQHKNFGGSGSNSASSSSFSSSTTPSPDNSFHSSPSVSCPGTPSRHSRRMAKKKRHRSPGDPSNPLRQSSERSLTSSSSSLPTFSPPSLSSLPSLSAVGHSSSSVVPDYGGLPPQEKKRVVVHIDMDCFYASVAIRDNPSLKGLPLVICPSKNINGTSEIAAVSYEARKFGIKSRMHVCDARKLCPDLHCLTCEYEKYEKVSKAVYEIFMKYTSQVQAVSADEAFLDLSVFDDPEKTVEMIRREIYHTTGCTASAGIADNMLLARLATKRGKPNGQYVMTPDQVPSFMNAMKVSELPGVGISMTKKLASKNIHIVSDILIYSKEFLQREFGQKKGLTLWEFSRGIDRRPLKTVHIRKSVGTQLSWGVRFTTNEQVQKFLSDISIEVSRRLKEIKSKGSRLSLKTKQRVSEKQPDKVLNPGDFKEVTKSATLSGFTDDPVVIAREAYRLYEQSHVPAADVRGMGLYIDKLNTAMSKEKASKATSSSRQSKKLEQASKNCRSLTSFFRVLTKEEKEEQRKQEAEKEREKEKEKEKEEEEEEYPSTRFKEEKEEEEETRREKGGGVEEAIVWEEEGEEYFSQIWPSSREIELDSQEEDVFVPVVMPVVPVLIEPQMEIVLDDEEEKEKKREGGKSLCDEETQLDDLDEEEDEASGWKADSSEESERWSSGSEEWTPPPFRGAMKRKREVVAEEVDVVVVDLTKEEARNEAKKRSFIKIKEEEAEQEKEKEKEEEEEEEDVQPQQPPTKKSRVISFANKGQNKRGRKRAPRALGSEVGSFRQCNLFEMMNKRK